jgi:hypothetical protein
MSATITNLGRPFCPVHKAEIGGVGKTGEAVETCKLRVSSVHGQPTVEVTIRGESILVDARRLILAVAAVATPK